MMKEIIDYLKETYHPRSILLYGSFADGLNDDFSDFDCMVIADKKDRKHDDSVIGGVQLDCFIFTPEETEKEEDIEAFLTAYDANIVLDDDTGAALKQRVKEYVTSHSKTDNEEKQFITSWIRKTMKRAEKNDDEGSYRAVSFLWESLTDYFLLRDMFYFGSKKSIRYLKENDPEGYELYHKAITGRENRDISLWAEHVISR
ncbi:MAG: hypothetical protein CW338_00365 [Clostridiales bacterium]|nr:hypothetical protein [Clostridiales bacterium]